MLLRKSFKLRITLPSPHSPNLLASIIAGRAAQNVLQPKITSHSRQTADAADGRSRPEPYSNVESLLVVVKGPVLIGGDCSGMTKLFAGQ